MLKYDFTDLENYGLGVASKPWSEVHYKRYNIVSYRKRAKLNSKPSPEKGGHDGAKKHAANAQHLTNKAETRSFESLLVGVGANADKQAFIEIFEYFAPRVKSFLMRGGLASDQAEELAQETMLAVWHNAAKFDPSKASASTWLYTIARNKKIDFFRKHQRAAPDPNDPFFSGSEHIMQDEGYSANQEAEVITQELKTLPEEQAKLVKMAFFEDKTHQEIAKETDIPLGTVKSRIRLALSKLAGKLGSHIGTE